jgi:hypothetical protein
MVVGGQDFEDVMDVASVRKEWREEVLNWSERKAGG